MDERDEIAAMLRALLVEATPGGQLPNERDLAARFGVSRSALRDRIRMLEAVGLVVRRQGAGTFVTGSSEPEGLILALDLLISTGQLRLVDLHEVRVALERQAAVSAARKAAPEDVERLRDAMATLATAGGGEEAIEADVAYHQVLMRIAGNPALTFFASALHGVIERDVTASSGDWHRLGRKAILAAHEDIADAIAAGDSRAAGAAVDALFALQGAGIEHPGA